jgi:hypothetical protein
MAWDIEIVLAKSISTDELGQVLERMPVNLKGFDAKQPWGWSMAVDVWKPEGLRKVIYLSGASFSAPVACEFAKRLAVILGRKGYVPMVGEMT